MWSVRVTIVGSRTLHEIRFRHDLDLEFSDIALVFNTSEGNAHHSGLIRRNQEVCATVIQKSEVQLSIVKSFRM